MPNTFLERLPFVFLFGVAFAVMLAGTGPPGSQERTLLGRMSAVSSSQSSMNSSGNSGNFHNRARRGYQLPGSPCSASRPPALGTGSWGDSAPGLWGGNWRKIMLYYILEREQ